MCACLSDLYLFVCVCVCSVLMFLQIQIGHLFKERVCGSRVFVSSVNKEGLVQTRAVCSSF